MNKTDDLNYTKCNSSNLSPENKCFKRRRLRDYDYSSTGAYFLTVCVKNRRNIFWKAYNKDGYYELSEEGKITEEAIKNIPSRYENINIDRYVVMPDHIHMLLIIDNKTDERSAMHSATVSKIVQQLKGYVTKQLGRSIWQISFYDHIIRNEYDYEEICNYIDQNPIRKITELSERMKGHPAQKD